VKADVSLKFSLFQCGVYMSANSTSTLESSARDFCEESDSLWLACLLALGDRKSGRDPLGRFREGCFRESDLRRMCRHHSYRAEGLASQQAVAVSHLGEIGVIQLHRVGDAEVERTSARHPHFGSELAHVVDGFQLDVVVEDLASLETLRSGDDYRPSAGDRSGYGVLPGF
jgi:hypothetical protein